MNETKYNFEFWRWSFPCDNFKKKQAQLIINTIGGSRLCMDMSFESYGHIEFEPEDKHNRYPEISYLEDFNRLKTNCLIYNLKNTSKNQGVYDKCFIYHSAGSNEGNYGYVFYNTETGKMLHKYFVEHEYDALCVTLNKTFNTLFKEPVYKFYSNKYDSIKGKNNDPNIGLIHEQQFWEQFNKNIDKYL